MVSTAARPRKLDRRRGAGEVLSNFIITRLPFAVPDHPVSASRLEAIERGGNSFNGILRARRRAQTPPGRGPPHPHQNIAVILDNRVLIKQYDRVFLNALPLAPREISRESGKQGCVYLFLTSFS